MISYYTSFKFCRTTLRFQKKQNKTKQTQKYKNKQTNKQILVIYFPMEDNVSFDSLER